jgi:mannose-6-phosphate isomerase-like protein (cupin superfamily)
MEDPIIRAIADCPHLKVADNSLLCELFHPCRPGPELLLGCSIAHVQVLEGEKTLPHRLLTSSEVYFIIAGKATVYIDNKGYPVQEGQGVYIPPGSVQYIENPGDTTLIFLAIVSPPWRREDEEIRAYR